MKRNILIKAKRLGAILLASALTITSLTPLSFQKETVHAASEATINLASTKQEIKGVGGMNHPVWISDLTEAQRETAFGNGDDQLGFSILRIHVDENKNNWYKELATAKAAVAKGALVFASPWNPPSDMTETFTRNGVANQKRLKYSEYGNYADYLNEFVTYMKNNGVDLYAISIQNEPDYAHTWTWWTPAEMLNFMKNYAGKINCKVMAPESFQYLKTMSDPILNDATALANMDILGTHFYGTTKSNMSYPLFQQKGAGKELWMTEVYVPNSTSDADTWPEAIDVAKNMHDAFATGNMQTYVWWYIRRSYGPMKENGQISKRGYCMAQYSKYVRPGYVRVDATETPNTDIYVSAYKGNNEAVIVAVNNGDSDLSQKFTVSNGTISKVDRYRTSANENLAETSNLELTGNGFWAYLPANSVSTFVCSLGSGTTVTTSSPSPSTTVTTSSPSPSASVSTSTPSTSGLPSGVTCEYSVVSDWGNSFQGQIILKNSSSQTYSNWSLSFNYNSTINSLWGAELGSQSGTKVVVNCPSWDTDLESGESVTIQFTATLGSDKNAPTSYSLT